MAETVYAAEWPGFPGETEGRHLFHADIEALDEVFYAPRDPDWTAISGVFEDELTAAIKETDASPIYDYEVEIRRPVPSLEESTAEKESWRERAKRLMVKASDSLRDMSVSALAMTQAKTEQYYCNDELGTKRKKITGAVAGALVLGASAYLEYKGISGSTAVQETQQAHHNVGETVLHHQEHVRQAAKIALHSGDNPWTVTEDQLKARGVAHPSEARIAADDIRLLKFNHISLLQAMKMHVGDKLKLLKVW